MSVCASNRLRRLLALVSTLFAPAVFYGMLIVGGGAYAPMAHATGGQCTWEGGPGGSAACKLEDCIEDGGYAVCREPEIRPTAGYTDAQADSSKYTYFFGDCFPPHMAYIAAWCAVVGGTWNGNAGSCTNPSSEYLGVGAAINEGAANTAADQFASAEGGPSCPATITSDSGWGTTIPAYGQCASGSPVYRNGKLLTDNRQKIYQACSSEIGVVITKTRQLVCSDGYASRNKPNGDLQCFVPVECCQNPTSPHPVTFVSGTKKLREDDYTSAALSGLRLTRYYNSQGFFRVRGYGPDTATVNDYWRTNFSTHLFVIAGNANLTAIIQRPDGSLRHYDSQGREILNRSAGAAERLQSLGASGWKLTLANADVEYFDSFGRLTSIVTRAGITTTLTYDGSSGRLVTAADPFGHQLSFGYDGLGRLNSITLPDNSATTYGYTAQGNLSTVSHPDGSIRSYQYEGPNPWQLTGVTDEAGQRYATYVYDGQGHVTHEELAGGADRYDFVYQASTLPSVTTLVTDPLGRSRQYGYVNNAGVFRLTSSPYCQDCPHQSAATFDANGNYASKTDLNGRTTTYTYDLTRNLEISRTEASGTALARTFTTTWDPVFRLPATITQFNRRTSYTYDGTGNLLTRTVTDTGVTPNVSRIWTYTYDSYGRVLTADGPRTDVSDVTTYAYYTCTTGAECGQVHTVTNALNQITTYSSYNADGQPLTIIDPNGVTTTLTYDVRQRLTSSQVGSETTTFEYWPTGLLKRITQPDGSQLVYTYDAAHRLTKLEDAAGNSIAYVLDAMGNRQAENVYDPFGALAHTRSQLFNNLGQLWQVLTSTGTDAQATVFGYDSNGNQTTVNAPLGRITNNFYDELNRLKQVTDPALGNTSFAYDANDNLTQVTDPRSVVTSYQYTGFGDPKQQTSPDSGTTTNTYDSAGNVQTRTDARGAIAAYTYDALNRVASAAFTVGSTTDQTITYTYDSGTNGIGRLTGAADANHSLSWTYDPQGRVTSKAQTVGGITKTAVYGYTSGRLTSLVTPSGQTIAYSYNPNNQITGITVNGTVLLSNVLYEPFGPVAGWTWGNGTLTVRSYDIDGRLTLIDSAGLSQYSYYDDGSISARTDETAGSYSLPAGTTSLTVQGTSNRIAATSGVLARTYSYDGAGNVTALGGLTLAYNAANRLRSVTQGAVTTSYVLDALGRRIRKSSTGGSTIFAYDEAGHLIGEYDGQGGLVEETIWLDDIPVATLRPNGAGLDIFYVHTDHLNTPRRVSRPADNIIVWRWDSDPFGAAAPNQDPDGDGYPFVYNLRFPGQYFDSESGVNYNYMRDYDPATGRYIESDPIGLEGGINTYGYVGGNPLSYSDPTGLAPPGRTQPGTGFPALGIPGPFDESWAKSRDAAALTLEEWFNRAVNTVKNWCSDDEDDGAMLAEQETLTAEEKAAVDAKNAGKPFDQEIYKRARQKQIKNEKYNKERNKRKRGG